MMYIKDSQWWIAHLSRKLMHLSNFKYYYIYLFINSSQVSLNASNEKGSIYYYYRI